MMKKSPVIKLIITIIIALLIPIFTYTAYQILQSNKNEALIKSIYDRQLTSILFSVNQHCWDIFSGWATEFSATMRASIFKKSNKEIRTHLKNEVLKHTSVMGAFVRFSSEDFAIYLREDGFGNNIKNPNAALTQKVNAIVSEQESKINSIIRRAKEGYMRPYAVPWSMGEEHALTLLLIPILYDHASEKNRILAGLFVSDYDFIHDVVARKFSEMNDGTFLFAVRDQDNKIVYITEELLDEEFEKTEEFWLLPHLSVQVKLMGTTLRDISKARNRNNLVFLVIVNVILLLGIFYLMRNVMREMSLAKMKTDFVANVSHELRTPLALIRMYSETLEMGRVVSPEKQLYYYRSIMGESARLTQLINNILDFSKIESAKKTYRMNHVNLSDLLQQVLDMYRFHLDQKEFQLDLNVEPDIPTLEIDQEAITQVLVNLLDNAIKYSADIKKIVIGLEKRNNAIYLSIQDYGIGIPESEQKKIFEKFYRVGSSLVHNTKGSGLGLTLVKHIMDMHHGQLTVKSKPGEGSTFTLIFPLNTTKGV